MKQKIPRLPNASTLESQVELLYDDLPLLPFVHTNLLEAMKRLLPHADRDALVSAVQRVVRWRAELAAEMLGSIIANPNNERKSDGNGRARQESH